MDRIRIMLADDHEVMRDALSSFLGNHPDMYVVAQAVDGLDVLAQLEVIRPDIICMDIKMQRLNGIDTTQKVLAINPSIKVIGLSAHVDPPSVSRMLEAGAVGYVLKGSAGVELLTAIRTVVQGQTYFSQEVKVSVSM